MNIIKQHRAYFALYFPALAITGYLIVVYSKSSIHLYFNQFHTPFFDVFFKYVTLIGDGWFITLLSLIFLLFVSMRKGLTIGISAFFASLITQIFKRLIFGETLRPVEYFRQIDPHQLHFVEGVDLYSVYSFPSGHTTGAFAMTIAIAFLYKSRKLDTAMFVLGALVGWSRVYLSQHFLEDVFMGSIIGILGAIIVYSVFNSPEFLKKTGLDKPLLNLKKNG